MLELMYFIIYFDFTNFSSSRKSIRHIFGPNLHIEVIKQSQVLLNFLAVAEEWFEYAIDIDNYKDYEYNEEDFDFLPSSKPKKKMKNGVF